jgi:hypothetical protein
VTPDDDPETSKHVMISDIIQNKMCFYVCTIQNISLLIDDIYSDSTRVLTTSPRKQCMDLSARPHVYRVYADIFNVCLKSRRWFMLCLVYISCLVLVLVFGVGN